MVIFNASFMMERELEPGFLSWFRSRCAEFEQVGLNRRISSLREAGGVDYKDSEAQTVAIQWEFDNLEEAREWGASQFSHMALKCEEHFESERIMVFTSIFEVID